MKNLIQCIKKGLPVICLCVTGVLTGCQADKVQVVIKDGQTDTQIAVTQGMTVKDILSDADIVLYDNDEVSPKLETVIEKDNNQIQILRCARVVLSDGGEEQTFTLTGKTVKDVLDQAGLVLSEHDYLNHDLDACLENGMEIRVIRRLAVKLDVDGEKLECLTKATDVEGLLAEHHIKLDKADRIKPSLDAVLVEGIRVMVERVSVREITEREPIPFETDTEYSDSMYTDEQTEKTPGVEGEKEVTYQVTYVDGKEENRKAIKETVLKEPVSQVVVCGTKQRRRIVSKQAVDDCDGSGHGYYIITWSDGTVEYQEY